VRAMPMDKLHGRILTPEAAWAALRSVGARQGDLCYIEALSTRPGESPQSAATATANHATWVRCCTDYGLVVSVKSTSRLDRLAGLPGGGARKTRVILWCREQYPDLNLTPGRRTAPHDGMADALLFAYAALRTVRMLEREVASG
jgi:hypothetical protein